MNKAVAVFAFTISVGLLFSGEAFAQRHASGRPLAKVSNFLFGPPTMSRHVPRQHWGNNYRTPARSYGHGEATLPTLRHDDSWGPYPKYYGGFHSSHFSDIGIPHGDRGFRGSGIFWNPW